MYSLLTPPLPHIVPHLPNSEAHPLLGSSNVLFCSRDNFYGPNNLVLIGEAHPMFMLLKLWLILLHSVSNNNPCDNFSSTIGLLQFIFMLLGYHSQFPLVALPFVLTSHLSYTHVQTDATWFILAM